MSALQEIDVLRSAWGTDRMNVTSIIHAKLINTVMSPMVVKTCGKASLLNRYSLVVDGVVKKPNKQTNKRQSDQTDQYALDLILNDIFGEFL